MEDKAVSTALVGLRRELKLTWDAHKREHELHDSAHTREHQFTAEALDVAAVLAKENKADANEWREAMNDREAKFATKADVKSVGDSVDKLEIAEIRRAETERLRVVSEAEDKRQSERRQSRSQWTVGIVVGLAATFGAILVNLVIRLATT